MRLSALIVPKTSGNANYSLINLFLFQKNIIRGFTFYHLCLESLAWHSCFCLKEVELIILFSFTLVTPEVSYFSTCSLAGGPL